MSKGEYQEKVFDRDILKFCLSLVDFIEALPNESPLARKAILDAVAFCQSAEEMGAYLDAIKSILIKKEDLNQESFLSTTHALGVKSSQEIKNFVLTIQSLSEYERDKEYELLLNMVNQLLEKNLLYLGRAFVAVRHSLAYFQQPESFKGIFRALAEAPQYSEAFAYGQLDSKKWLIEEATQCWGKDWGTVFVLAGWVGVLPRMIFDNEIKTTKIRSFDIDEAANKASEFLNQSEVQKDWHYKSSTQDITKLVFPATYQVQRKDGTRCEQLDTPDVVINTSCEHIADMASWWKPIPKGTKVILQTNDGFHISDHVACFKNLNEFEKAINLSRVDYRGEKTLPEFNRFMLIGTK